MKQFKAESKRLMDLMINSIYTNREIFLRELISNASDAIDKLYYKSLTDSSIKLSRDDFEIRVELDKEKRIITVSDNGCGMTQEELESNLGTIAKSGSLNFKNENEKNDEVNIIGQFGVGFYSSFMVSKEVKVYSKAYGTEKAYCWHSKGVEGYTIEECEKESVGTKIELYLKDDTEDEKYSDFLDEYKIKDIIKRYSDYIRYPIKMECEHQRPVENQDGDSDKEKKFETYKEVEVINSMIPIWKKNKTDITDEQYNSFYTEKFGDFENPLKVIHTKAEGGITYNALLYIPSRTPYDYYTKEYEKGLQLYSNGVLIMDKCAELLPDYFSFVKGLVDSQDLSLNISREVLQHDRQLKVIGRSIEKKIKSELENMLKLDREKYVSFFKNFGNQIKYGIYSEFGMNKDNLQDLIMFYSSTEKKLVTLSEYVGRMKEGQEKIYYAAGESIDKIDMMPQVEGVKDKGYEILYLTDDIDEFVIQVIFQYDKKQFANVSAGNVDLDSKEEKEELEKANEESKDMFSVMKEAIPEVEGIRFTHKLKNHPVCLTSEGALSIEMQKTLSAIPNSNAKAQTVLEINENHPIADKLKALYKDNKEELKDYTKILYNGARLIEGLTIDNPTEFNNLICDLISRDIPKK